MISEAYLEAFLIAEVKRRGGNTRKVVYQGRRNAPDRWCFLPNGRLVIIELKAPGEVPRSGQIKEIMWLQSLGFHALWTDSKEGILEALDHA